MSAPVLALHIRGSGNIGDRVSGPLDYFALGGDVVKMDVAAFLRKPPTFRPRMVVAGGGAWKRDLAKVAAHPALKGVPKVAWGVGVTSRKLAPMPENSHTRRAAGWDLYAHRDVGLAGRYVPCASCMHEAFNRRYATEHEAVYYGHGALMPLNFAKGIGPHMTNLTDSMEEAIAFLGSGEVVVTSSYHGAYWARLLGRHVAMLPRGSKFWHLPKPPKYPWEPTPLEAHRILNHTFRSDVMDLLRGGEA